MKSFIYLFFILMASTSFAQLPFVPLSTATASEGIQLPTNLTYQILFSEDDTVRNQSGALAVAKGDHDYNCYIPSNGSSKKGLLYVSHECNDSSTALGDGGGATVLDLQKLGNSWKVTQKNNVDFSSVGGTITNCSGVLTAKNTIITAEEFPPSINKELYKKGKGFRDTSDYNGRPRWQNMGWMVEADPVTKKSIKKLYSLGRYSHEGAAILPDNKTMFLTDDYSPAVFFKFVATKENDFSEGQLYAYSQGANGVQGTWLPLPMNIDSLSIARDVALRMGATFFLRLEWLTMLNGKIYMSETGTDNFWYNASNSYRGSPASHLQNIEKKSPTSSLIDYPFGAVLEFDYKSNHIKPLILGAAGNKFPNKHFSNPDGISFCKYSGKDYLVINEDIIGKDRGRVPATDTAMNKVVNDIWWLDLAIKAPVTDDLHKMATAPYGAETTGGYFTPDFKNYFVNVQHPSTKNKAPWNKACTLVITGW